MCTSCTAPELFACRDALDADQCQTTCAGLGCSGHQFNSGTDCVATPQCYGDCCDAADSGCSQVPQAACTPGGFFFANSYCDASSCVAAPPSATPTATPTITGTSTSTATATATATPTATLVTATATASHTPLPSATNTATTSTTPSATTTPTATLVTATATASHSPLPSATNTTTTSATPSATTTGTASLTPTPSVTPSPSPTSAGELSWLLDDVLRLTTVFTPRGGSTFVHPRQGHAHSLDLQDSGGRFCTQAGLFPQIRLALDAQDCEDECFLGIFPPDSTSAIHIAHLPALNRPVGTFDVLIDTVIGCQPGQPPTTLRMVRAVTYTGPGDCDGDGDVAIEELLLGVNIALGARPSSDCLAQDLDSDGAVQIHELIAAVRAALGDAG